MGKLRGKNVPITPFRRLVGDLMVFSRAVPSVTAERRMDLSRVAEARRACSPRPTWSALFMKAYALAARSYPELRWSYLKFPWPRFYEHPHNIAVMNVERESGGEHIVVYCLVRSPENRSLAEIDEMIRYHRDTPLDQLRSYQRALATSKLPFPIRRLFWWGSLNVFGRRRCHNFGTFGLTSVGALGAGVLRIIPLLTSTVHYGLFDANAQLDVRLSWDHRVFDGWTGANVLVDLERILNNDMVAEMSGRPSARAA
jgi:pyruvate/2-oxoglutarate dehydrogenase complex dihydrolipoamide acyltransferase (E2) component